MAPQPFFTPIRALSKKIKNREISPIQLTEYFLDRLERIGPSLNSVVSITRDRALKQAKKAEEEIDEGKYRGLLHGIPYGAKDLISVKGTPTTWGAAPFRNQMFDKDATVVKKLDESGAILIAKLSMIELAGGMGYRQPNASLTGPPRNPWNTETWTGGSSSGSGAAVAAGIVPFAIGSETWGSILSPANNCGVAGIRPTYGRVSRNGAMALSWSLDKLGPLCLTADDCGIVLEAISGEDPDDPNTIPGQWKYQSRANKKQFSIGAIKDVAVDAQNDVKDNFEAALTVIKSFSTVTEIELQDLPYEAITRTILSVEAASAFEDFVDDGLSHKLTAPEDHWGPYARTSILAKDYLRAVRLRAKMAKVIDEVMEPFDVLVGPTSKKAATPIGEEFRKIAPGATKDLMGAIGNGAGLPSISVPNGFTTDGLPTGIQFMGRAYEENTIITIAKLYQRMTKWHLKHPLFP